MISRGSSLLQSRPRAVLLVFTLSALLGIPILVVNGQPAKLSVLRIGSTSTLTGNADGAKEKAGRETLHQFVKDETGLNNEIVGQEKWQTLADKLAKGQYHLGVFHGYEFAWAQEKYPDLKPLVVAVNADRYPVALVLTKRDNPATDFAGLRGQSLAVPTTGKAFLRLFVDRQSQAIKKKEGAFFSKITSPDNVEDALDDVVDGTVQAIVIDQAALEAFKRRKPGRFNLLKEVARSQPFPSTVVAYYGTTLDDATLKRFKNCLLNAPRKEKGEMLLTLSRLTGFEGIPENFAKVLAETRKAYPVENAKME
jgi:ABC-type phosphate/phosphonate transport system substrate-binding protein